MTPSLKPALRVLLAASVLLMASLVLGGCAPSASTSAGTGSASTEASAPVKSGFGSGADTAQGHFDAADQAIKASVPDAVFISVQTGTVVTDPSPVWIYLFASKKKNKAYAVTVAKGVANKPVTLPTESLRANEWAKVPTSTVDWKIDSNVALKNANAAFTTQLEMAPPKRFVMGMSMFVAEQGKNSAGSKPYTWVIVYQPDEGAGVPGVSRIEVDAKTGKVAPLPE